MITATELQKYLNDGFTLFPLKANSKAEQLLPSRIHDASNDILKVISWKKQYPKCNFATKTGNGLLVIDVDVKNGKNGVDTLEPFLDAFPKTRIAKSCNGGYHYYFKTNRPIRCSVNLYDEIDIRADGGYIVLPPSEVDGRKYEWINDEPIAEANDAVYEFLNKKKASPIPTSSYSSQPTMDNSSIQAGTRNDTLFRMACSMQAKGFADFVIMSAILEQNRRCCNPPLPESEIISLVNNVEFRYTKGTPKVSREEIYQANELIKMEITDRPEIIEDILPSEGVTVFGAPQKIGKTFFCLQLANSVAEGKPFLGFKSNQCEVVYLALEDTKAKVQTRLIKFGMPISKNLTIIFQEAYKGNFDYKEFLIDLRAKHPNLGLVIADTFAKVRNNMQNDYSIEYKEMTQYHELGIKHHIMTLFTTHTTKKLDRNNVFDGIAGSKGITAGADAIWVMLAAKNTLAMKEFYVTGKDIPEDTYTVAQNERLLFNKIDFPKEQNIDKDVISVVYFVTANRLYEGTMNSLAYRCHLKVESNVLSRKLRAHENFLMENYIQMTKLKRKTEARNYRFEYFGNNPLKIHDNNVDNDTNDMNVKNDNTVNNDTNDNI